MTYLVDANVLSEVTKPDPAPQVVEWLREHDPEIVVDPVILGEIRFGILLLPEGRRRKRLLDWFESGVDRLHCIPWDAETGRRWARLLADLRNAGQSMPVKDSLIAATALRHELPLVTRNEKDFRKTGLQVVNPFGA